MWRTIKKGKHNNFSIPSIHFGKTSETYEVMFDESCRYDLQGVDQLDWNKLFGWSYGNHHKNSIRVGWRYNPSTDKIEVSLYLYYLGKRWKMNLDYAELEIGKKYNLYLGLLYVNMPVLGIYAEDKIIKTIYNMDVNILLPFYGIKPGYNLDLYFGGDEVAPHDIRVWLKKV